MRKLAFCKCKSKDTGHLCSINTQLVSTFFAAWSVQSSAKFHVSSNSLELCMQVCVEIGQKHQIHVRFHDAAQY